MFQILQEVVTAHEGHHRLLGAQQVSRRSRWPGSGQEVGDVLEVGRLQEHRLPGVLLHQSAHLRIRRQHVGGHGFQLGMTPAGRVTDHHAGQQRRHVRFAAAPQCRTRHPTPGWGLLCCPAVFQWFGSHVPSEDVAVPVPAALRQHTPVPLHQRHRLCAGLPGLRETERLRGTGPHGHQPSPPHPGQRPFRQNLVRQQQRGIPPLRPVVQLLPYDLALHRPARPGSCTDTRDGSFNMCAAVSTSRPPSTYPDPRASPDRTTATRALSTRTRPPHDPAKNPDRHVPASPASHGR